MTERLFYSDSHLFDFSATVLSCIPAGEAYAVELDRTAFFPGGGGQLCDTGSIGGFRTERVYEKDETILHEVKEKIAEGETVRCTVDREPRLRRMQNHSGEHIFSGITHRLHGYDNVGFHMGEEFMTIDFSGELTSEQIDEIERLANEAIRDNLEIRAGFPEPEVLRTLEYRSKLELTHDVRIVEIPGIDMCACCAPHVSYTGEIGILKVLTAERHRGGMRITIICGMDAFDRIREMQRNLTEISVLLSAKREESGAAVRRLYAEKEQLKERCASMSMQLVLAKAASILPTEENICLFEKDMNEAAMRELLNLLMEKTPGLAAVFNGDDETGYRYIIASRNVDLRARGREINQGISGRGGGVPTMIQGQAKATSMEIENYIKKFKN